MKPRVLVLAGPTASGKTALSLPYAQRHGCEIVCMDSMQIYRGMEIGTAKPTPAEQALVPHHLLDVADPREPFSVAQYQQLAEKCMAEILSRGNIPLLVGGTGFYLRALRHPMAMGDTPADSSLRASLEAEAAQPGGALRLHDHLREVDPVTAARLHPNDQRRVIRALEVYAVTGRRFSEQPQSGAEAPFDYRVAALTMPREVLYPRIDRRVDAMLETGLLDEVKHLLDAGVPPEAQAMKGIGYKELVPVVRGSLPLAEAADQIRQNSRHYAKRQFTWFRREEPLRWIDALAPDAAEQLERYFAEET